MTTTRARRPRWLFLAAVMLLAGTAAVWVVAARASTAAQRAARSEPPPPSVVTAEAKGGSLVDEIVLDGVLSREVSVVVRGPDSQSVKSVVTRSPRKTGDPVDSGDLLAEVSGRPVIALRGEFPAYRDLTVGDNGRDVRQLQTALRGLFGTPVTGTFNARTSSDVRRLYRSIGYQPMEKADGPDPSPSASPTGGTAQQQRTVVVPAAELAYLGILPATVSSVSRRVGDDARALPLLTLAAGAWDVVAPVDDQAYARLAKVAEDATWTLGDGPLRGRKGRQVSLMDNGGDAARPSADQSPEATSPAEGQTAQRSQQNGEARRRITIRISGKGGKEAKVGAAQRVSLEVSRSPADAVIVPVSAIWTGPGGVPSVTIVGSDGQRDAPVRIHVSLRGQVAVSPTKNGALRPGDSVAVAYRDEVGNGG